MMKQLLFGLTLAAITASAAAQDRVFALVPAGEVDSSLLARVQAYLEENSTVAVRLAPAVPSEPGQNLEQIGRIAAMSMESNDHGIIVLARSTLDQPQGVCLPDDRFGVLNLARLEVGADAARIERRAGQEGLRVMSMLLGMAPCPFPLCVLVGYDQLEDLDEMSGNFCPPCLDRFERVARKAGLRIMEPPRPDSNEAAVAEELPAGEPATPDVPAAQEPEAPAQTPDAAAPVAADPAPPAE